jgi:hypothetical protein
MLALSVNVTVGKIELKKRAPQKRGRPFCAQLYEWQLASDGKRLVGENRGETPSFVLIVQQNNRNNP